MTNKRDYVKLNPMYMPYFWCESACTSDSVDAELSGGYVRKDLIKTEDGDFDLPSPCGTRLICTDCYNKLED